jgi:hypothetical protein
MWAFFMVRALMRKKDCMENELFSDFSSSFPCPPQRRKIVQIIYCVFSIFSSFGNRKNACVLKIRNAKNTKDY